MFIEYFGLELAGAGIARAISFTINLILIKIVIKQLGIACPYTIIPYKISSLQNICSYIKETTVVAAPDYLKWFGGELV